MNKEFVRVVATVDCKWEGLPPIYRVFVNDELFAERTWAWADSYIEELLQISAAPGKYHIHYELVPPHLAELTVQNLHVEQGNASVKGQSLLRIHHASE